MGRHHVHEVAGGGGRAAERRPVSPSFTGHRLGALRPERTVAHRPQADAPAPGKRAGRDASVEGGTRRILRHRFSADVSAAEERGNIFSIVKYARTHRGAGTHAPPGPVRGGIPARCRDLLPRAGPRLARPLRTRGREVADRRATGRAGRVDQAMDLGAAGGPGRHSRAHAGIVRPAVWLLIAVAEKSLL